MAVFPQISPCCVPSRQRAGQLEQSRVDSAERMRATAGLTEGMVRLDGGAFLMGTDSGDAFPEDGEGPVEK
jgi:formylglycine-generating enzyme